MILMIIFIALFVLGVLGGIAYKVRDYDEDMHLVLNLVEAGIGILGVVIGTMVIIMNNNDYARSQVRLTYQQEVEEFNATRSVIETIQDDYARSVAIQQYNTNVKEFKQDIIMNQLYVKNPWISWFCNQEYKNLDVNVVSYITTF